ncbi:hypothetical protein SLS53_005970 [Cytospora paraplurivora]|uniref:PD-(D/E)XK nuclease-like domain-containing protein n=1 Tax=Cytospora paraplurivora TaxID=2898453 RepID=A0AAN9YFF0_9PEZI
MKWRMAWILKNKATDLLGPDDTPKPRHKRPVLKPPHKKRTATSPRKSRAVLDQLQKPVRIHAVPDYSDAVTSLPADVMPLYRRIAAANDREKIVPCEVRQEVSGIVRDSPRYFRDADPVGGARAKAVLNSLHGIKRAAADSQTHQRCESGWNNLVHTPLLQLVFDCEVPGTTASPTRAHIRVEPVMSATIAGDSIPYLRGSDGDSLGPACSLSVESLLASESSYAESDLSLSMMRSRGVKVDYVLALDIPEEAPLRSNISQIINNGLLPHVNQTAYLPLKESPIAVAIETKTDTSGQDPLVQLGIWTAAWYQRMYDLREQLTGPGPKPRLVSVPLIQVVGHSWHVYFACDVGTSVDIFGPIGLGSTDGLMSLYVLLSSLEAIKEWAESTFHAGMETWFLCREPTRDISQKELANC